MKLNCKFFGYKILGQRTLKISYRNFRAPTGTHHTDQLGTIPPTDSDDISQSTPNFWPIVEF